jgi:light-regulated signal transduction histidine kinase (bacteriophytochrome)
MEANLRELDSALSQFLDFARSERDESIVNADLFDIASECVATYDAMNDSPSESTTHVIKLIGTHGTRIRARPQALMRALTNLIENSRKYSAGDIEIAVERLPTCALIVRDRGERIAKRRCGHRTWPCDRRAHRHTSRRETHIYAAQWRWTRSAYELPIGVTHTAFMITNKKPTNRLKYQALIYLTTFINK